MTLLRFRGRKAWVDLSAPEALALAEALLTPGRHALALAFVEEGEENLALGPGLPEWVATEVHTGPEGATLRCGRSQARLSPQEAEALAQALLLLALGGGEEGGDHADLLP